MSYILAFWQMFDSKAGLQLSLYFSGRSQKIEAAQKVATSLTVKPSRATNTGVFTYPCTLKKVPRLNSIPYPPYATLQERPVLRTLPSHDHRFRHGVSPIVAAHAVQLRISTCLCGSTEIRYRSEECGRQESGEMYSELCCEGYVGGGYGDGGWI
jgi:hypothetical protein